MVELPNNGSPLTLVAPREPIKPETFKVTLETVGRIFRRFPSTPISILALSQQYNWQDPLLTLSIGECKSPPYFLAVRSISLTVPSSDIPKFSFETGELRIHARPNGLFGMGVESVNVYRSKSNTEFRNPNCNANPKTDFPSNQGLQHVNEHLERIVRSLP